MIGEDQRFSVFNAAISACNAFGAFPSSATVSPRVRMRWASASGTCVGAWVAASAAQATAATIVVPAITPVGFSLCLCQFSHSAPTPPK